MEGWFGGQEAEEKGAGPRWDRESVCSPHRKDRPGFCLLDTKGQQQILDGTQTQLSMWLILAEP